MPIYSGDIGEMIEFSVLNAGTVTGVKFGASAVSKKIKIQNLSTILARVPDDASWGHVDFFKTPNNNVYNVAGSGYANSGALNDLQSNLSSLNLPSTCTSGDIVYSNSYEATAICDLNVVGQTKTEASGILYNAYGSGLCGNSADGFTISGYSTSSTRLHNYATFENSSGNWLAVGNVQDTGNFIYKTANLDVSCLELAQETTPYKFVPIPLITDFNPKEGGEGSTLKIDGRAFIGVTNVAINNVPIPHQVVNNNYISGSIPAGNFEHKVQLTAPSGIKANSLNNFVTFESSQVDPLDKSIQITKNQSATISQGQQENVSVFGSNFSGITLANLTDQNGYHTTVNNDPSFIYASNYVSFSPQNLNAGTYDVYLANDISNDIISGFLKILGEPSFAYSYQALSTTNLINEPQTYSDRQSVQSAFYNRTYGFSTTGHAEKFCLSFNNNSTDGFASYELQKAVKNPTSFHLDRYYIRGTGENVEESAARAQAKWQSGIYTEDEFGELFSSSSYVLEHCLCSVVESGNALYGYNPSALYVSLFATGVAQTGNHDSVKLENENTINQNQSQYYPDYTLLSITHSDTTEAVPYSYSSGISYPFSRDVLLNCDNSWWSPLYQSGMADLYPGTLESSGCSHTSSNTVTYNTTLSGVGNSEGAARAIIEAEITANYMNCTTGTYNVSTITMTDTIAKSGVTYGYC